MANFFLHLSRTGAGFWIVRVLRVTVDGDTKYAATYDMKLGRRAEYKERGQRSRSF